MKEEVDLENTSQSSMNLLQGGCTVMKLYIVPIRSVTPERTEIRRLRGIPWLFAGEDNNFLSTDSELEISFISNMSSPPLPPSQRAIAKMHGLDRRKCPAVVSGPSWTMQRSRDNGSSAGTTDLVCNEQWHRPSIVEVAQLSSYLFFSAFFPTALGQPPFPTLLGMTGFDGRQNNHVAHAALKT
jgi:hypothetical protein